MASTRSENRAAGAGRLVGRAHRGFRRWRRGRPFWGGLFTLLGGVEILLLPLAKLPLLIQVGIAGISGVVAGVLMVVMGLAVWFAPHYRVFAGIATILLALASFLTSNLGGFLLGMLLGLLGGSLSCAWVPLRPRPSDAPADPSAAPSSPDAEQDHAAGRGDPTGPDDRNDRDDSGRDATAEPTAPPPDPVPADLAPAEAAAAATATTDTDTDQTGPDPDAPAPTGGATSQDGGRAGRLMLPALLLVTSLLAAFTAGTRPVVRLAATQVPTVNSVISSTHADTVEMSSLSFDGVVQVPTLAGPLLALKFSMGGAVMHGYTLDAPGGPDGGGVALAVDTLTLQSNVDFYATRITGLLSGTVPVTFTPDAPPVAVPPDATFTDFSAEQVFVSSDGLTAAGLGLAPGTT